MFTALKSILRPETPDAAKILAALKVAYREQKSQELYELSLQWLDSVIDYVKVTRSADTTWHNHAQQRVTSSLLVHAIAKHRVENGFDAGLPPLLEHANTLMGWSVLYEGPGAVPWNTFTRQIQSTDDIDYPMLILGLYAHLTKNDYTKNLPKLFNKLNLLTCFQPVFNSMNSHAQDALHEHIHQTYKSYKLLTTSEFIDHLKKSEHLTSRGMHALLTAENNIDSQYNMLKVLKEQCTMAPVSVYNCGLLPNNPKHPYSLDSAISRLVATFDASVREPFETAKALGLDFAEALNIAVSSQSIQINSIENIPLPKLELDHLP